MLFRPLGRAIFQQLGVTKTLWADPNSGMSAVQTMKSLPRWWSNNRTRPAAHRAIIKLYPSERISVMGPTGTGLRVNRSLLCGSQPTRRSHCARQNIELGSSHWWCTNIFSFESFSVSRCVLKLRDQTCLIHQAGCNRTPPPVPPVCPVKPGLAKYIPENRFER
jgi:hypothetical protein